VDCPFNTVTFFVDIRDFHSAKNPPIVSDKRLACAVILTHPDYPCVLAGLLHHNASGGKVDTTASGVVEYQKLAEQSRRLFAVRKWSCS